MRFLEATLVGKADVAGVDVVLRAVCALAAATLSSSAGAAVVGQGVGIIQFVSCKCSAFAARSTGVTAGSLVSASISSRIPVRGCTICAPAAGPGGVEDSWPPTIAIKLDKMFDVFIEKTSAIKTLLV